MFTLSSIPSCLESWPVNHTSLYESSELKVFKNIKSLDEISNDWMLDLCGTNVYEALESRW